MKKTFTRLVAFFMSLMLTFFSSEKVKAQVVYSHSFTSGSVVSNNYNQTPDVLATNLSVGTPQWTSNGTTALTSCSGNQNLAVSVPTAGSSRSLTLTLNVAPDYTFNLTNVSAKLISGINNGALTISVNGNAASNTLNFVNTCTGEISSFNTAQSFTGTVAFVITATNSGNNGTQNIAVDDFVLSGTVTYNALNNLGINSQLASSAYSLRKLRDTYTGSAIQVRRSGDNATQNIGFTAAGNLDTTALKTFIGGGNGFVTIWYDQSGNARNLTQATTGKQPTIVNAGVIYRKNNQPTLYFDATDDGMLLSGSNYLTSNGFSVNLVAGSNSASTGLRRAVQGSDANNWLIGPYQNTHSWFAGNWNHQIAVPWSTTQVERFTVIQSTSSANTSFRNGTSVTSGNIKSVTPGKLYLGTEGTFNEPLDGFISEVVSYATELNTTDRQSMETSQAAYYSVSTNANLTALTTTAGTIAPVFTANTTAYTASVSNATSSVTVTPTREQANATIEVRVNTGTYTAVTSGTASGNLALNVGSNTIDLKVTAQDGTTIKTYTITVTRNSNPPGNALNFDGTNDRVTATVTNLPLGNSARTYELWLRTTTTTNGTFLATGTSEVDNQFFGLTVLSNSLYLAGWNNDFQFTTNLTDGKWHHVAATHDGTTARLYVDGSLIGSSARTYNTVGNTLVLGTFFNTLSSTYQQHFNGSLDEVRIWNTARTQAEIQANMFNNISASSAGLVAYYDFDNGTSGGTNTGLTTLTDRTTNANTGTLTNFALTGATSNWLESYAMVVPTATAATSITATGFTANWSAPAIGIVTNYLLDVSTSSTFASFVSGYNGLIVSGTSQAVTGLTSSTTYYYRVRADKTSVTGQGGNSNTISPITLVSANANLSALTTTAGTIAPVFTANTTAYTATVSNATSSVTVTPTREQANATIEVRVNTGTYTAVTSGTASGNLALNIGSNTIDVKVTAQDGTTIKTYTITVTRAANPPGNALRFDGTNDFVNIPDANSLDVTTNYTIESWVNISTANQLAGIVSKNQTAGSNGYMLRLSFTSPFRGLDFDGLGTTSNTILETGKWYHIAAVKNGATRTLYVNGVAQTLSGSAWLAWPTTSKITTSNIPPNIFTMFFTIYDCFSTEFRVKKPATCSGAWLGLNRQKHQAKTVRVAKRCYLS